MMAPIYATRRVWYAGRDGTGWNEAFRPAFGTPKMSGTRRSTGQVFDDFWFHLPPWNGLFHVRGTENFNILGQKCPLYFSKFTASKSYNKP
ncbi:hypothetical protein DVH24_004353 [Malus domestica]|uniref:Uncharacterized protein n=1 Tax=Malus domestica TaxID=3750 RepID=A0A498K855_MALDO|nr:hypothetical protein DVH24_004353 [Malus domestica]